MPVPTIITEGVFVLSIQNELLLDDCYARESTSPSKAYSNKQRKFRNRNVDKSKDFLVLHRLKAMAEQNIKQVVAKYSELKNGEYVIHLHA